MISIDPWFSIFVAPELLFLHYVFWLGQHVYIGTSMSMIHRHPASATYCRNTIFNFHFHFWSSLHIDESRLHENGVFQVQCSKKSWTVKISNSKKLVLLFLMCLIHLRTEIHVFFFLVVLYVYICWGTLPHTVPFVGVGRKGHQILDLANYYKPF